MSRSAAAQARRAARMAADAPITTATVDAALAGDHAAQVRIHAVVDAAIASRLHSTVDAEEAASFIAAGLWETHIPAYDDKRNPNFTAYIMGCAGYKHLRFMSEDHVVSMHPDAVMAYAALVARCGDDLVAARSQVAGTRVATVEKFDAITAGLAREYGELVEVEGGGFDPASVFDSDPAADRAEALLGMLDPVDAQIVRCSFGMDGAEPMTDEQVAEWVGLSRSRITQRRLKAMETMSSDGHEQ